MVDLDIKVDAFIHSLEKYVDAAIENEFDKTTAARKHKIQRLEDLKDKLFSLLEEDKE